MKAIEVEIAVMKHFGVKKHIIVPNVFWGIGINYECDLVVLTQSGYATEVEIKVSKGDLLKDKKKRHSHNSNLFKYLYFAVPEKLKDIALSEIPERAGLFVVTNKRVKIWDNEFEVKTVTEKVKVAAENKEAKKWGVEEKYNLARLGAMRILGLKKKIANCT